MDYILWLPSWYPNTLTLTDGDFIQRQANAASLLNKIVVFKFQKDIKALLTKDVKEVISSKGNLTEILVYYHPFTTGIKLFDKILSAKKYKEISRSTLEKYFKLNGDPSLVHVHVAMKAGLQALSLKRKKNIQYLLSEHWSGYYPEAANNIYNSGWLHKTLTRSVLKNSVLVIPVAKKLETAIKNFIPVKTKIVPNVVNTSLFFYKPSLVKKFRFIHVSSMSNIKNPEGIIRAAKLLANENIEFELFMIGKKDPVLINLATDMESLNKYLFFKEEISYEEVAVEMQSSSALVMFSRYESLPCVIIEALCCGLPVISSDVGGISEIIHLENGILVESENDLQLKDAMKRMILNYSSYNRESIAKDAFSKYNYDLAAKQFDEIYKAYK